jgi:hypothetical protein
MPRVDLIMLLLLQHSLARSSLQSTMNENQPDDDRIDHQHSTM